MQTLHLLYKSKALEAFCIHPQLTHPKNAEKALKIHKHKIKSIHYPMALQGL